MPVARARVSRTGKLSAFTTPASRASAPCKVRWVGRMRSRSICFSHVSVAVRQGQRRDAVATGEERHGRCAAGRSTYIRLYRHSGKLALAPIHLRRARVVGRSFAAGAQPLTHVCTVGTCGKKNSAWASGDPTGGRRVEACLERWSALPQRATRREVQKPKPPFGLQIVQQNFKFLGLGCSRKTVARDQSPPRTRTHKFTFSVAVSAVPPLYCSVF